ncbi:protein kinase [Elysia marginata]|uniref:non-specific serine/threonine protein kinase n=1 Tax=Elysia marginata TaxID=1093978 RepID=A0AAV4HTP7_9GAST|nr:protein kinase [Elysia marginata]
MPYYDHGDKIQVENENGKPFDKEIITNSILHVENAVDYLHKHHFAHNDIKPDNVFVDKWGYVHLRDFGFVRQMTAEARTVRTRDLGVNISLSIWSTQQCDESTLIRCYTAIKCRDYLAYSMPYYDHGDKIQVENENGKPFDKEIITNSILHVENAVDYLHKHHFAHNDIKPDNVFVDKWGYAHLGDFGFVRKMNADTRTVRAKDLEVRRPTGDVPGRSTSQCRPV